MKIGGCEGHGARHQGNCRQRAASAKYLQYSTKSLGNPKGQYKFSSSYSCVCGPEIVSRHVRKCSIQGMHPTAVTHLKISISFGDRNCAYMLVSPLCMHPHALKDMAETLQHPHQQHAARLLPSSPCSAWPSCILPLLPEHDSLLPEIREIREMMS